LSHCRPVYLDTSALAKLIIPESESRALFDWLRDWPEPFTCTLARVELLRLLKRGRAPANVLSRAEALLGRVDAVHLDPPVLAIAAQLKDPLLRTLDAIHLACALSIGDVPEAFVTYDARLARAAERLKLVVVSPTR
jgi:uncharacterized protein